MNSRQRRALRRQMAAVVRADARYHQDPALVSPPSSREAFGMLRCMRYQRSELRKLTENPWYLTFAEEYETPEHAAVSRLLGGRTDITF